MTLRSVDIDDTQLRGYLIATLRARDPASRGLGHHRAGVLVDAVLEVIRETGEDLDAVIDDIAAHTAAVELEISRSRARTARVEHALGIVDVVAGELAPSPAQRKDSQ